MDEAVEVYHTALKLEPNNQEIQNNLGVALRKMGKLDEAVQVFQDILKQNIGNPAAQNNLGLVLAELERSSEAESAYNSALNAVPDYSDASLNLADLYIQIVDFEKANLCLSKAILRDPKNPHVMVKRGMVLQNQGRLKEARKVIAKSSDIEGAEDSTSTALSNVLRALGEFESAITILKSLLPERTEYTGTIANLALIYQHQGEIQKAEDLLRRAINKDPDNPTLVSTISDFGNSHNIHIWEGYLFVIGASIHDIWIYDLDSPGNPTLVSYWDEEYFNIWGNEFCPPYPECIEDYIGSQSNWGIDSCELGNCYDVGVTQITALELYGDDLINPYDDIDGSAYLLVTMHNDGPDCSTYPGLMITTELVGVDFPDATSIEPDGSYTNWWYAMFADDTYFSEITFEISPFVPIGTEITFTARAIIMGCLDEGCSEDPYCHDCPLTDPVSITLTIGDLFPSQLGDVNMDISIDVVDIVHMIESCLKAPENLKYDVFFAISNNILSYRDIKHAQEKINFQPLDSADNYR